MRRCCSAVSDVRGGADVAQLSSKCRVSLCVVLTDTWSSYETELRVEVLGLDWQRFRLSVGAVEDQGLFGDCGCNTEAKCVCSLSLSSLTLSSPRPLALSLPFSDAPLAHAPLHRHACVVLCQLLVPLSLVGPPTPLCHRLLSLFVACVLFHSRRLAFLGLLHRL